MEGVVFKEIIPDVITSDILPVTTVDMSFDALHMPIEDNSIDAFFMVYTFHHIKNSNRFFYEIHRCLRKGGRFLMIEPTNNLWGSFVLQHIHHEHYDPMAEWEMEGNSPMSSPNSALAWIVFKGDSSRFEREFCYLTDRSIRYHKPFSYLVSGGVTASQFLPTFMYAFVKLVEFILSPLHPWIDMYSKIELEK